MLFNHNREGQITEVRRIAKPCEIIHDRFLLVTHDFSSQWFCPCNFEPALSFKQYMAYIPISPLAGTLGCASVLEAVCLYV